MGRLTPTITLCIATILLLTAAPSTTATNGLVVRAGETLVTDHLVAPGDLLVQGDVRSDGALLVEAAGRLVIEGRLLAGDGAGGVAGGDVTLRSATEIVIAHGATILAGAGGDGAAALVPGALARGQDGGAGGWIRLDAPSVTVQGDLAPGRGGDGGEAQGLPAVGGRGGASGAALVNGADSRIAFLHDGPAPSRTSCTSVGVGSNAAPLSGANGGNACALGTAGISGSPGADGADDPKVLDKGSWPDCVAFGTASAYSDGHFDGEQGGPGTPGLLGGPATATGGAGGSSASGSTWAGNGGAATATGGAGGTGGHGGMGGNSNGFGNGCNGGPGGAGGNGGSATATGGLQGVNALDCTKNGASGAATANGGSAGAGGWGGAGGGGNWPYSNGASGAGGASGVAGAHTANVPPMVPCVLSGVPTVAAHDDLLTCDKIVLVMANPNPGTNPQTGWKVYLGTSSNGEGTTPYASVFFSSNPQTVTLGPLTVDQPYFVKIRAVFFSGDTGLSGEATATPHCLTAVEGPDLTHLGLPCLDAPVIAVVPASLSATVTITPPTSISGVALNYKLYRGAASGSESFLTNVPYAGPSTPSIYVDTVLIPGATWYYATLQTTTGESCASNHALAVVPPLAGGGTGGDMTARKTSYGGGLVKTETCSLVPVKANFGFSADTGLVATQYAAGTASRKTDSVELCAAMASQSRTYATEQDPPAGCDGDYLKYGADGSITMWRTCGAQGSRIVTQYGVTITKCPCKTPAASGDYAFTEQVRELSGGQVLTDLVVTGFLSGPAPARLPGGIA